jgi:malonyl-CoA O-methyltransferase
VAEVRAPLAAREGYRLWAPRYGETAVSALEERVVAWLNPSLAGRSLLDAGCGTGRRLPPPSSGLRRAVGVDLSPEMIRAGGRSERAHRWLVAGDLRMLPLRDASFDLVWCRLALGHLGDLAPAYRELARVAAPGATLIVSDFHPAAAAAGHARTFRDASGVVREVEHFVHTAEDHARAAGATGWSVAHVTDAVPGEPERPFYERAGRSAQLERERDLPLVLAICLRR